MKKPDNSTNVASTISSILVNGDVVVDHHIYEGERTTASAYSQRGVKVKRQYGGAAGLSALLQTLLKAAGKDCTVKFALTLPDLNSEPCGHHALATWKPFPKDPTNSKSREKVWRASLLMGYGHDEHSPTNRVESVCPVYSPKPVDDPGSADLLILDDAGFVFRHRADPDYWLLPKPGDPRPGWVILKMSGPVCQGDLWPRLAGDFGDRLICIVSANDLRKECVNLSTGLSWERTVEDLGHALQDNPVLKTLMTAPRHLIVNFSADGALWLDHTDRKQPKATLIFDAGGAEGGWAQMFEGEAFGYTSCLVAAITRALISQPDAAALAPAVADGLGAMRNLRALGHGLVGENFPDGFPYGRLAEAILKGSGDFSFSRVPWTTKEWAPYNSGSPGRAWRIVEMSQCPFPDGTMPSLLGLARQVVLQGPSAIRRLPHASFGSLLTADRFEIETLRTIRRFMLSYRETDKAKKPLSIGVFGPPGAGKSFGVKQLANGVFGEKAWLEFNLSQFSGVADLIGAFHQVRDLVLSGITPVVFWDEFDSKEYDWLQYLLAPMQDGRFQEGQLNHAIGKCVFIFAGGTSHTFEEFGPAQSDLDTCRSFRLRKGPDFHSRLDVFYNVLGPNIRLISSPGKSSKPGDLIEDTSDVCAPLRRALLIRALLNLPKDARIDFDSDLLDAMLQVSKYKHGARSMEKVVAELRPSEGGPIRRSAVPPPSQLAMHVDAEEFNQILGRNASFRQAEVVEALAPAIHETWRSISQTEGWSMQPHLDRPYNDLSPIDQEENRAAARRIPEILALAGLTLEKRESSTKSNPSEIVAVQQQLAHHLERLAEEEHQGWWAHRERNGWRPAKQRDDEQKLHPALVPYSELSDRDKEKDRNSVRHYPEMVELAGYKIIFLPSDRRN